MTHAEFHPEYQPDCFGCKASGVGFDGKTTSQVSKVETDIDRAKITDHRDGRRDVTVFPKTLAASIALKEG